MRLSKKLNRLICLSLSTVFIVNAVACSKPDIEQKENTTVSEPNINITVVDEKTDVIDSLNHGIAENDIDDIYSMVCSSVELNLESFGFQSAPGIAMTAENDDYNGLGIYFYDEELSLFTDDSLKTVGFVEIVPDDYEYFDLNKEQSLVVVDPLDTEESDIDYICSYSFNQISSSHFVYQDKYVTYYQQNPMRVVYHVYENIDENYDLAYGSLYDYDNKEYIYDESIFTEEYLHHSAMSIFSEEDYLKLEEELRLLSEEQEKAGFIVEDYNIVYISPESIQAYIDSQEEATFFGYSVDELSETFGQGVALEYTNEGFKESQIVPPEDSYNWKKFVTEIGIGCGIIIVAATITTLTGGPAFTCALWTMTTFAVTGAFIAGITTVVTETAIGMLEGKDFKDALYGSKNSALDAFSGAFLVLAAEAARQELLGERKPSACFVGETLVKKYDIETERFVKVPIEQIKIGDYVASYDENTKTNIVSYVSEVYKNSAKELVKIYIDGECITTTLTHPFFSVDRNCWVSADELGENENLLNYALEPICIDSIEIISGDERDVYNLTVEDSHNYYVGESEILVHNMCDAEINKARSDAVRKAWAREVEAVRNGTSKYNWTKAEIHELLETGKITGYDGHHIRTVRELRDTAEEYLIGSADDIVFLSEKDHLYVHGGNFSNSTDIERLVELVPWITERFGVLGIAM